MARGFLSVYAYPMPGTTDLWALVNNYRETFLVKVGWGGVKEFMVVTEH